MSTITEIKKQLGRFSLVGVANTGVDFVATNLLFFLVAPATQRGLLLVSLVACLVAMINSYLWNSRWTFAGRSDVDGSKKRFLLAATIGMVVNTTVFLFLMRHLPMSGLANDYALLNLARLGGVAAAMAVTFLGYRLWAFAPKSGPDEGTPREDPFNHGPFPVRLVTGLMGLGLLARVVFFLMAPVFYGDAVNYAWVARLIGTGEPGSIDFFWHSLFDFWQALLVTMGLGLHAAPVVASLIPGVLLIWPIALITWRLFGNTAAVLSASIAALHPRLIEYSLNGYAESFYLLGAVWATWGFLILVSEPRRKDAVIISGVGLSVWLLVRNEAIVYAGMCLLLAIGTQLQRWRELSGTALRVALIVAVMVSGYAVMNLSIWGETGLMQKGSNLARSHIEMIDPREAAREVYGEGVSGPAATGPIETIAKLASRWPGNIRYTAERLPGVLLSPLFVFALLLPILRPRSVTPQESWPVLALMAWPILFYPFIQLEPRMLFPTLIGVIVLGSAGLCVAGHRIGQLMPHRSALIAHAPAAGVIALLLPLIPLLAWHSGNQRGYHREVGEWIADSVPAEVRIVGDGYGYVSASAFWAERQAEPRLWTDTRSELSNSVDADTVLLLYERYLRESNPELLSALDDGLPGMTQIAEFEFEHVGRVQAWRQRRQAGP